MSGKASVWTGTAVSGSAVSPVSGVLVVGLVAAGVAAAAALVSVVCAARRSRGYAQVCLLGQRVDALGRDVDALIAVNRLRAEEDSWRERGSTPGRW